VFPDIADDTHSGLVDILGSTVIGRTICHTWYDEGTSAKTVYSGKIEELKKMKGNVRWYKLRIGLKKKFTRMQQTMTYLS